MEIATGYFAKAKDYADMGYALVSIAKVAPWFLPKGLNVYHLPELAPTDEILELRHKPEEYAPRYEINILSNLSVCKIIRQLELIARQESSDKVVLLCYESPEKFCHRHLVAKWLGDFLAQSISELEVRPKTEWSLFDSDV